MREADSRLQISPTNDILLNKAMRLALACILSLAVWGCQRSDEPPPATSSEPPASTDAASRYIFYLHGRIVEDQGADAVSPEYGPYDYRSILQVLGSHGAQVVSEVRAPDTDPEAYADSIARQLDRLMAEGVEPDRITVVGASKGGVITMLVSDRVTAPIRYVMLANCNPVILDEYPARLHGHVLSIYEASDDLGESCEPLFARSPDLVESSSIRLETGLRHGFLFRPLEEWVMPALQWAEGN